MHRNLEKLSSKRWKSLCGISTPFTPTRKIWYRVRAFQSQVTQTQPFRAIAVSLCVSATAEADEFCIQLAQSSDSVCSAEYVCIAEAHHAYEKQKCLSACKMNCESFHTARSEQLCERPQRAHHQGQIMFQCSCLQSWSFDNEVLLQVYNSL